MVDPLRRGAVLVVAIAALAVAGCGGGGSDGGSAGGATEFIEAVTAVPASLDTTNDQGVAWRNVIFTVGSKLVAYDPSQSSDKGCEKLTPVTDIKGDLAESWKVLDDGHRVRFQLRKGVMSAAGNELTAEDVKWSFERERKLSPAVQFLWGEIAHFDEDAFHVVSKYVLDVSVKDPTVLDEAIFTWGQMVVLDSTEVKKHVTKSDPDAKEYLTEHIPTFGPWVLDSFQPNQEVVFTANPDYWDKADRGNVSRLVMRSVPDASTRLQLLRSGEADYAQALTFDQYASLKNVNGVNLTNCVSPNRDLLALNQHKKPLSDLDVRKAISMAIDREALVRGPYKGFALPSTTGLSSVFDPTGATQEFTYDPDQAKSLLAKAGYPNGFDLTILVSPTRPGAHAQSVATALQAMLGQVGVRVKIKLIPGASEFSEAWFKGRYDAMLYMENPGVADPYYALTLYNKTGSFQNQHGYSNADYDRLTAQIASIQPGAERDQHLAKVSDLIVETMPLVYLTEERYVNAWSGAISNQLFYPNGEPMLVNVDKK